MQYFGLSYRVGYQPSQRLDAAIIDTLTARIAYLRGELQPDFPSEQLRFFTPPNLAFGGRNQIERELDVAGTCLGAIETRTDPLELGYEESVVDGIRRELSRLDDRLDEFARGGGSFERARDFANLACHQRDVILAVTLDTIEPYRTSGWVLRFGLFTGHDVRNDESTDDRPAIDIYGFMLKNTLEYNWTLQNSIEWSLLQWLVPDIGFGVEGGMNAHYVHGQISPFWYATFPLSINVYPFARRPWPFIRNLKAGVGVHVLPPNQPRAYREIPPYRVRRLHLSHVGFHVAFDISLADVLAPRHPQ